MQPGDIVESVDMEMSDDENDSKPKGRVLVDLRLQDRDMRVGAPPPSHHDMDMRMIPLPIGQMPGPRDSQLMQDIHLMRSGPPPPPPLPQFQHQGQGGFRQEPEFSHCKQPTDFHPNQPKFQQNRPPNFLRNQQDFHSNQEFHQLHQSQQDFEYCDREHNIRSKQDFLSELPGRGRYSQSADHQHQHDSSFHRNEWNNRGGGNRGFPRNRRDRYSEDHNVQKQRNNLMNSRKSRSQDQQHHQSPSEILPNNRPLLQPPDTAVIFDEEGVPIAMPEFDQDNNALSKKADAQAESERDSDNCPNSSVSHTRRTSHDTPSSHDSERNQQQQSYSGPDHEQRASSSAESEDQSSSINQVTVIPIKVDNASDELQQKQHVPISKGEEQTKSTEHSDLAKKTSATDNEPVNQGQNVNSTEKESLDESTTLGKEMKRTANGDCDEQSHEEGNPNKKRTLLQNGPQTLNDDLSGPNGPPLTTESHPAMMYEYDGPNFRPRIGGPFPLWRGGPPPPSSRGGRGGFRGGPVGLPRGPWMDRGPRGPATGNFSPRGLKRGGKQFWGGGGFRGRGRGSNW